MTDPFEGTRLSWEQISNDIDEIKVLVFLENCIGDPMWPSHFEMHKDKAQEIISIIQKLRVQNYALQARFDQAIKLLKQNTGLLCESANLNNYRNLSDQELGKAWTETATRTALFLNEVEERVVMTNTIAPPTLEELNKIIDRYESLAHNTHPEFKRKQDVKLYCLRAIRDQKEILK